MNEAEIQRQKEIKEAEELLFTGRRRSGSPRDFSRAASFRIGRCRIRASRRRNKRSWTNRWPKSGAFLDEHLDPVAIDRNADIPRHLIDGLAAYRRAPG